MRFVLVGYGSRGDVEPVVAVAGELARRGHDTCIAVPPDLLGFVESAGLAATAYGPDARAELTAAGELADELGTAMNDPIAVLTAVTERVGRVKADKTATLATVTTGADLLVAGFNEQGLAANVAESAGIPLAALHVFPPALWLSDDAAATMAKQTDAAQRPALGLPEEPGPSPLRLEIQAYDQLCLPAPARGRVAADTAVPRPVPRPFVGALTLQLPTAVDDDVMSWIAQGTPPIYFGFGSTPLPSAAETVVVLAAACEQLGERALIGIGAHELTGIAPAAHVKIVDAVNHAAIFPACRAVVHHGGAGATAAGLRAGRPTLILWSYLDQPMWAAGVAELQAGTGRGFFDSTLDSLVADLRTVLAPDCAARAAEVAAAMTTAADSVVAAADLLEALAGG